MKLLQHFKELTIRPKNAKELKGLILQLAIQGKLTRDSKSWNFGILSDLGPWATGSGFPKTEQGHEKGEIPFIKVSDMNLPGNTKYINSSNNYISKETALRIKAKIHPTGTVVFPKIGGAIATNKRRVLNEPTAIDNNCLGLVPNFKTCTEWVFLVLSSIDMMIYQSGTSVPSLSQKTLEKIPTSLPPLEEQKEIVKVVETLFKEVEQLEQLTVERIGLKEDFVASALNQLTTNNANQEWSFLQDHFKSFFNETTNIKKLRETVLQLAVQGKLTADWRANNPDTEDASVLLKRILKEKAQLIADKKIKKEKALPKIIEDEIPYELPDGWVWCRFGDLITFLNGHAFKSSTYVPTSAYQIIRLGNVKNDNFKVNTKEAYVPSSVGQVTQDYQLFEDDILTTLTGTKNRRDYCFTCLVKKEHLEQKVLLLNQRVGCIRVIDKSASELFNKFLKSDIILNQLFETETGTANQGNIGSTAFKNLVFPLPPIEEQKAIVQKVNALMGLCDRLEQEVQQSQEQISQLMQSCLREVFEPNNLN
jgi:type I restriction enzyme S subunit